MLYCMASQVSGGATNATMASSSTMAIKPASNSRSASRRGVSGALAGVEDCGLDAGETRRPFQGSSANDHARIDATSHIAATAARVSNDAALRSSVVTATQTPHRVAEMMKLVRQSRPRRRRAIQLPEKARNGRITELLRRSSILGLGDPTAAARRVPSHFASRYN